MHRYEFNLDDNMEDISKLILERTNSYLEQKSKEFKEEVWDVVAKDIEEFMYERFDNVRHRYFEEVVGFLLGKEHIHLANKRTLQDWLQSVGYTEQSFRKKVFEENKDAIIEAIKTDAEYEFAKNLFDSSYYKSWTFADFSGRYPQSDVVKNILYGIVNQKGFTEVFTKMLDVETRRKMADLNDIKSEISELSAFTR